MATQDNGGAPRGSARARSLMAAASLLGLSLGVGIAHAAESSAPAAAATDPAGTPADAARSGGHYIKMDSSQIKGDSQPVDSSAHFEKWRNNKAPSDQIKGEDKSSHVIKLDSNQIKGAATDSASHQIKLEGK